MKKNELLKAITENSEIKVTQAQADAVLHALATVITTTLMANHKEKITLPDLGEFKVKEVGEKKGVSALNGKEWVKPAHGEITFKVRSTIKELV